MKSCRSGLRLIQEDASERVRVQCDSGLKSAVMFSHSRELGHSTKSVQRVLLAYRAQGPSYYTVPPGNEYIYDPNWEAGAQRAPVSLDNVLFAKSSLCSLRRAPTTVCISELVILGKYPMSSTTAGGEGTPRRRYWETERMPCYGRRCNRVD